ncbi:MAG: SEC-C domain-containing protein [Myxococcota bacterium]
MTTPIPWLAELQDCEDSVPEELQRRILALGPDAVGPLIELIDRERANPTEDDAPLHAIRLLAALGQPRGLARLVKLVEAGDEGFYDALNDTAILALEGGGPPVVELALAALARTPNGSASWGLLNVLSDAGVRDERIFDALLDEFDDAPDFVATSFGVYGDERALPHLRRAFRHLAGSGVPGRGPRLIDVADAIEQLGGELDKAELARVEAWRRAEKAGFRAAPTTTVVRERPGRNAPCWCGSGKKYKRCHWAEDETNPD